MNGLDEERIHGRAERITANPRVDQRERTSTGAQKVMRAKLSKPN
jgi:hypothetical protein